MCERVIERLPSMTAEERVQLRRNCDRAIARSGDGLVVQEARRLLRELEALELRETSFLARLPAARRIEYAFRRLPASEGERDAIRLLHEISRAEQATAPDDAWPEGAEPTWQRPVREMCRQRRHLLQACEDPRERPTADPLGEDWLAPLVEADRESRSLRLRPEAEAAFISLGYVVTKRRSSPAE